MRELRFRVVGSYGRTDVAALFDEHTTIGQFADSLEKHLDRSGHTPRSIHRRSRGSQYFSRNDHIFGSDLRSGDEIELALDTGVRTQDDMPAVAMLRVVNGPESGRVFDLQRGESTIGRSKHCTVTLNDDMASRTHASVRVTDIVEVADAGSTNGVLVNDQPIDGVRRLRPGDRVLVGDTEIIVELLGGTHEAVDFSNNTVEFNRPPRIDRPFSPVKIGLPAPLDPPPRQRFPLIAAIVPVFMAIAMYFVFKRIEMMLFMALSPVMMFGNYWENKRSGRAEYILKTAEHEATLNDQIEALSQAHEEEVRTRFRFFPDNNELLGTVADLSVRLWEREVEDEDFLDLRVGLKEQPSKIQVDIGNGGTRDQRIEMEAIAEQYRMLPPVPLSFNARREAPVGIAGPNDITLDIARSVLLQSATLQAPSELVIGALISENNASEWDWLKWLPHNNPAPLGLTESLIAVGSDRSFEVLNNLHGVMSSRNEDDSMFSAVGAIHTPQVLLLVDGTLDIERSRFRALLEHGQTAGISVVWLSSDSRRIPNACRTVISVEPGNTAVSLGSASEGVQHGSIPLEGISLESAEIVARAMSPIVDISADHTGSADVPNVVSLVDLLGGLEVLESPAPIAERWQQSKSDTKNLRAPVGATAAGPLVIDLRIDGPHALVGGTTGAGKSEFLQSLLTGLAAFHSPERITFLLVDYKGGSAFGELVDQFDDEGRLVWRGLRHTVGMITDLTPAMVQRALVSLQAELHRREVILNQHRMKDLMEMEKNAIPGTPPSLLIVVDEFAALAKEVPAFVDGIVDIAQRGRSLGMHLVLATQKPGGVVTPNIQANSNLRVALRVASEEESRDIVGAPDAGRLDRSTPGRGVIKRGPTDLVQFQSAYVGGQTRPSSEAILELGEFHLDEVSWFGNGEDKSNVDDNIEVDLKRLVRVINSAADSQGVKAPRRPWLDPLPDVVDLLQLPRPESDSEITFGLADLPKEQSRTVATFRPDEQGSMLVYGMGGSGKTVALRSIATAFGLTKDRSPVFVYGMDFAGRGLDMLTALPHVGSIVPGDDYEQMTQLMKDLRTQIAQRSASFGSAASLTEYRQNSGDRSMHRVVVLLDGVDNFYAAYERIDRGQWSELLPRLVADGRQVGVHFVLTGTRRSSFPMALASSVSTRLVFKMASDDDYHAVNVDPKYFDKSTPPGRCRIGDTEVQIASLGAATTAAKEAAEHQRLGTALQDRTAAAPEVRVLPSQIERTELAASTAGRWCIDEAFNSIGPDISQNLIIAGGPRSGKTVAVLSLYEALKEMGQKPLLYGEAPEVIAAGGKDYAALNDHLTAGNAGLIIIDDVDRLKNPELEMNLQQAIANNGAKVMASALSAQARSYDPTIRAIRGRCSALILQPDPDTDTELAGGAIPRTSRAFPPGRGYLTTHDGLLLVQVGA